MRVLIVQSVQRTLTNDGREIRQSRERRSASAHSLCPVTQGYRAFEMPGATAGKDPLEALYKVTGGPTATVRRVE